MASADIGQSSTKNAAATPQPADSAALEQRIDELLKDVEQSLEALEQSGIDTTLGDTLDPTDSAAPPDAPLLAAAEVASAITEPAPPVAQAVTEAEPPAFDLSALSADLESALHEAEQAVGSHQEPAGASEAASAPESLAAGRIAEASPAPIASPETIDALDAALAEAATAAALDDGVVAQTAAESPVPAPIPAPPIPEPVAPAEARASRAADPEPAPVIAAAQAAPHRPIPAPAPAMVKTRREGPSVAERILRAIASPLAFMSPQVRDLIGWFGVWVAFNAVCVWVFVLLVNPAASKHAEANAPAADRQPAVELNAH